MEKDFHFYCIASLAKSAGFNAEDALTIAFASQYVDDATEHKPVSLKGFFFHPVRTAHKGLKSYDENIQYNILIPFHFLPANPVVHPGESYITAANSPFAQIILRDALREKNETLFLYRLGVALHTFADTWAHQGFSGRKNFRNRIFNLFFQERGKWKKPWLKKLVRQLLPPIGHAKVLEFPDKPFLKWKYRRSSDLQIVHRDNPSDFLECARQIYFFLRSIPKKHSENVIPWKEIAPILTRIFNEEKPDLEQRCASWKKSFAPLFSPFSLKYRKKQWREEAYENSQSGRIKPGLESRFLLAPWTQFHEAAACQKKLVLAHTHYLPKPQICNQNLFLQEGLLYDTFANENQLSLV